ncbi:hypothetical protein BaRGS_00009964 [Batillaria attramentaria]|uniref:Uncharacterized protein n=1 Tax=Batillaria attramentaria TaxID=370345 RepID=A0ABD0LH46_9CAEN
MNLSSRVLRLRWRATYHIQKRFLNKTIQAGRGPRSVTAHITSPRQFPLIILPDPPSTLPELGVKTGAEPNKTRVVIEGMRVAIEVNAAVWREIMRPRSGRHRPC